MNKLPSKCEISPCCRLALTMTCGEMLQGLAGKSIMLDYSSRRYLVRHPDVRHFLANWEAGRRVNGAKLLCNGIDV